MPSEPATSHKLTSDAAKLVASTQSSTYQTRDTIFDRKRGIFRIDCSTYLNELLRHSAPLAYASLDATARGSRPLAKTYFELFRGSEASSWQKLQTFSQLQAGDIIVWKYSEELRAARNLHTTGHVVLAMQAPEALPNEPDVFSLKVSDAARSGHHFDSRSEGRSGIGVGTMLFRVDAKGAPIAVAWNFKKQWQSHVDFAMARPLK